MRGRGERPDRAGRRMWSRGLLSGAGGEFRDSASPAHPLAVMVRRRRWHGPNDARPRRRTSARFRDGRLELRAMLVFGSGRRDPALPRPTATRQRRYVMGRSLYERLGGNAAITAVIDDFVVRCAADG